MDARFMASHCTFIHLVLHVLCVDIICNVSICMCKVLVFVLRQQ